jgi:hypothetical protein
VWHDERNQHGRFLTERNETAVVSLPAKTLSMFHIRTIRSVTSSGGFLWASKDRARKSRCLDPSVLPPVRSFMFSTVNPTIGWVPAYHTIRGFFAINLSSQGIWPIWWSRSIFTDDAYRGARTHNGGILDFESNIRHDSPHIDSLFEESELLAEDDLPTEVMSAICAIGDCSHSKTKEHITLLEDC